MSSTILIIEDNQELRENAEEILSLANYKVLKAENGKTGIELARNNKPDLILCDINMPELDGYCVLTALNNIPDRSNIPFVFMTAYSENSDFRKGMDLGADDYLTKPFDAETLLRIVSIRLKKYELLNNSHASSNNSSNGYTDENKMQKEVDNLLNNRPIRKLRKKDILFNEGDPASFLYLIKSGKIKTFKLNDFGKEYIIDINKEGDFLGYFALLEDEKHKVSAMSIENSEIALIPKQDFCNALYSNNDLTKKFVKMMSKQFSDVEEKLLKLAYDSARKRVAEAIIFVSKKYVNEGSDEISFNLHRENISALSGISPESVSRNLSSFKEEGLIETSNGSIKIKDYKKLESLKN